MSGCICFGENKKDRLVQTVCEMLASSRRIAFAIAGLVALTNRRVRVNVPSKYIAWVPMKGTPTIPL